MMHVYRHNCTPMCRFELTHPHPVKASHIFLVLTNPGQGKCYHIRHSVPSLCLCSIFYRTRLEKKCNESQIYMAGVPLGLCFVSVKFHMEDQNYFIRDKDMMHMTTVTDGLVCITKTWEGCQCM